MTLWAKVVSLTVGARRGDDHSGLPGTKRAHLLVQHDQNTESSSSHVWNDSILGGHILLRHLSALISNTPERCENSLPVTDSSRGREQIDQHCFGPCPDH